jgi:hypothetical protein
MRVNIVFVEVHHFVKMIERYHDFLRRVYTIIVAKISQIDSNSTLQMTFKALNVLTNLYDLILTLLVFDAYSRMIEMNVSTYNNSTINLNAKSNERNSKERCNSSVEWCTKHSKRFVHHSDSWSVIKFICSRVSREKSWSIKFMKRFVKVFKRKWWISDYWIVKRFDKITIHRHQILLWRRSY